MRCYYIMLQIEDITAWFKKNWNVALCCNFTEGSHRVFHISAIMLNGMVKMGNLPGYEAQQDLGHLTPKSVS